MFRQPSDSFQEIEILRERLLKDERFIEVHDFGSGSFLEKEPARKISDIARSSLSPKKYSGLYYRICRHINAEQIVELGTSLGINTLYLAQSPGSHVTTFEGASRIAESARTTFQDTKAKNILLIEGNISKTLPEFLLQAPKIDLVLIDANHRYEPTRQYFEWFLRNIHPRSIIIVDDIHRSEEMEKAWIEIKDHKLVYGSIDIFRCGIVLFDPSLNKQHVVLQY